jgi:phage-related protein
MGSADKPLVWLHGQIKTPPFSAEARIEAGVLLRRLQGGEQLGLPQSRPLPVIGARCHELRIPDAAATWRIVYRTDPDAIIIAEVFSKKSRATPRHVIQTCRYRLRGYDDAVADEED